MLGDKKTVNSLLTLFEWATFAEGGQEDRSIREFWVRGGSCFLGSLPRGRIGLCNLGAIPFEF